MNLRQELGQVFIHRMTRLCRQFAGEGIKSQGLVSNENQKGSLQETS